MSEWTTDELGRIGDADELETASHFVDADHGIDDEIDDADRAKYSNFRTGLDRIIGAGARSTTMRLVPRD